MENAMDLFTGVVHTEMDSVPPVAQPADTSVIETPPEQPKADDTVLNWWEITWRGYDGIIRTIEGIIYKEWPNATVGIHPWGNKDDHHGIPMFQIIKRTRKPKPDPRELLAKRGRSCDGQQ